LAKELQTPSVIKSPPDEPMVDSVITISDGEDSNDGENAEVDLLHTPSIGILATDTIGHISDCSLRSLPEIEELIENGKVWYSGVCSTLADVRKRNEILVGAMEKEISFVRKDFSQLEERVNATIVRLRDEINTCFKKLHADILKTVRKRFPRNGKQNFNNTN